MSLTSLFLVVSSRGVSKGFPKVSEGFPTTFRPFPEDFRRFPKGSEGFEGGFFRFRSDDFPKPFRGVSEGFPTPSRPFPEDFRRFPKSSEEFEGGFFRFLSDDFRRCPKMFRGVSDVKTIVKLILRIRLSDWSIWVTWAISCSLIGYGSDERP